MKLLWIMSVLAVLSMTSFAPVGCKSASSWQTSVAGIRFDDIEIDPNQPAPFGGVLVTRARYNWLRDCEGWVLSHGILP